jgi:uncharacterized membrane-anchored protein
MIADKESKGWVLDQSTGRYRWEYGNGFSPWVPFGGAGGGIAYSEPGGAGFVRATADGEVIAKDVVLTP